MLFSFSNATSPYICLIINEGVQLYVHQALTYFVKIFSGNSVVVYLTLRSSAQELSLACTTSSKLLLKNIARKISNQKTVRSYGMYIQQKVMVGRGGMRFLDYNYCQH